MPKPSVYEICNSLVLPLNRSADEYLALRAQCPPLLPLKVRDEHFKLPDSELLNAIHYYLGRKRNGPKKVFDESAMLMYGFLVEHWIEELIGDGYLMFEELEFGDKKTSKREKRNPTLKEPQIQNSETLLQESETRLEIDRDSGGGDVKSTNSENELLSID